MISEINRTLIFNYFSGKASAIQKELIEQWAREKVNKEQFFIWLQEWEHENAQYFPDVDQGIARHWSRFEEHGDFFNVSGIPGLGRFRQYGLAAAITLLIMACGALIFRDNLKYEIYQTDFNETSRVELKDGSKIVLNSNSILRVPRFGFGSTTRNVLLDGEAEFDITHTRDNKRFIVKASKGLEIVVLGTRFNVYTRQRGTKVILNKGKVQLNYQEGASMKQLTMKPGDLVTMDVNGKANIEKTDNPEKFSAWKGHRFVFDKTTLREVCHLFEDNFGVQVQIRDSTLAELTISGSFTALNADELIGILTDDSGLNYEKSEDGKTIILSF